MFPDWISKNDKDEFIINADIAYPAILAELKAAAGKLPEAQENEAAHIVELRKLDLENLTQYWVEVAYNFAKLEFLRLMQLNAVNYWGRRQHIEGSKEKWHFSNLPPGRGVEAAAQGKEARELYRHLRGFIPQ